MFVLARCIHEYVHTHCERDKINITQTFAFARIHEYVHSALSYIDTHAAHTEHPFVANTDTTPLRARTP